MRPYNDADYRAARAWLTAHPATMCWKNCGRNATTIDHDPPIVEHTHQRGTHCCALRPACATCNYSHGATLGNTKREPHSEHWW